MFLEIARIRRLSHTIMKPTAGASVRQASVSCQEMQKAPAKQAKILSGSVTAPPKTHVIPLASISEVPVTWAMKPADPCRMNWARSTASALSNTFRRMSRVMFVATHATRSVLTSRKACLRNVLTTTNATTHSTVVNGSAGRKRWSQGSSFSEE